MFKSIAMVSLIICSFMATSAFADYFDLAQKQQAEKQSLDQDSAEAEQTAWQLKFDSALLRLGARFATKHRGFETGYQMLDGSNSTTSYGPDDALILDSAKYKFSTNDGNECILSEQYYKDDYTGPNGDIRPALHCISSKTGKHIDKSVRLRLVLR